MNDTTKRKRDSDLPTEKQRSYYACMTIAGSDPSGGAGIEADLKTFAAIGCYGQAAITAVTVQNTLGVKGCRMMEADLVEAQIRTVWEDWLPDAVKIGMTGSEACIKAIARPMRSFQAKRAVLDPVMVSTSGFPLMDQRTAEALVAELMPLCNLITPNLPEMRQLLQMTGKDAYAKWHWAEGTDCPPNMNEEMAADMGRCLSDSLGGCSILVKGGHGKGEATDVLWHEGMAFTFRSPRIDTRNTHGTGCTLSSAVAAFLALGEVLPSAVKKAKHYLSESMQAGANIWAGHGNGPLNHFFAPQRALFHEKSLSLH